MRKLSSLLCLFLFITACDDGDVIEFELDFEEELTLCDILEDSYLLYKIKDEPYESLSLLIPKSGNETIFRPTLDSDLVDEETIDGNSKQFDYRTYNGDPNGLICTEIIDPSVRIISDYSAAVGAIARFTTSFVDDDNDGVPYEVENPDDLPFLEAPDNDNDGIPDYADADDDNDNVPTINELGSYTTDGIFLNTDQDLSNGDNIPNYLDPDDDGDMILTRNEDEGLQKNPTTGINEEAYNTDNIPRYLDPMAVDSYEDALAAAYGDDLFRDFSYIRTVSVQVSIINADIEVLRFDTIDFGTYTTSYDPTIDVD